MKCLDNARSLPLKNTHQMHERSSPVIFDVVGGAGRWKSSENRGGSREGKSGVPLLPCSIVLTWLWVTAAAVLSSLSSFSGNLSSLSSLLPSLYFPSSAIIFPSIISPTLLLLLLLPALFSPLCVCPVRHCEALLTLFLFFFLGSTVREFKTIIPATKTTSFGNYCDWFPCSLGI